MDRDQGCRFSPRSGPGASIDVLRIQDGAVAEVVTFEEEVFPAFELPRAI